MQRRGIREWRVSEVPHSALLHAGYGYAGETLESFTDLVVRSLDAA